jgi:hypothetical protein
MAQNYTVQKGDCLASIAAKFKFGDYKIIYNHAQNAALKQKRPKPNLLAVGDVVFIPDTEIREESGATDKKHTYQIIIPKVKFRVVVKDDQDKAFGDKKYELEIDGKTLEGNTDGSGLIEQEIPATATQGKLKVFTEDEKLKVLTWDLELGALDPSETDEGSKGRLKNLNFYFGEVNSTVDDKTKESVKAFQKKKGITDNGELTDETRNKLRDSHDVKS